MKEKIKKIVKYGVPFLVLLILLFTNFFISGGGSAEFGSIGHQVGIIILILGFLILYFIAGIIVWAVSKNNFIFISAIFSFAVIFFYYIVAVSVKQLGNFQGENGQLNYGEIQLSNYQPIYDSLTVAIEKSGDSSKIEDRALLYLNKICYYDHAVSADEKRKKHFKELETAAENNTQNLEVYSRLNMHYLDTKEYETGIKVFEKALKTLTLSETDKCKFERNLKNFRKYSKEKIKQGKADTDRQKKEIEKNKLLIKNLTIKFQKEGFNSEDLTIRGTAYHFLDKENEALADFNKAIEINPDNSTANVQKAEVLEKSGRYEEAVSQYQLCIKKYPECKLYFESSLVRIYEKIENRNK